jgi:hypothetical protein
MDPINVLNQICGVVNQNITKIRDITPFTSISYIDMLVVN